MQFTFTSITAIAALASTALASPIVSRSSGYKVTVLNSCSETIWPGAGQDSSSPSQLSYADSGFELASGASRTISVPADWVAGRFFARTGCTGTADSDFSCAVGDCGAFGCLNNSGIPGVSLAEFSYSDMGMIFYNLSLISGYNLGLSVTPTDATCPAYSCESESCSDSEAYQLDSSANPCYGCALISNYVLEFCPS